MDGGLSDGSSRYNMGADVLVGDTGSPLDPDAVGGMSTRLTSGYSQSIDGEEMIVPETATNGGRPPVLSRLESTVAYGILDLLLERLKLLGVVTVDATTQAQELSRSVGEEISRVMEEQKVLEERFESLIQARTALKDMPNKSKFKENQDQLNHIASKLRQTTLTLRRNLKDNPNISDNVAKIHKERLSLQTLLVEILDEMEEGSYMSLSTRLSSITARDQVIADTITRERDATNAVRSLRKQTTSEKEEHMTSMAEKKKVVQTIKEDLKQTKSRTKVELKYRLDEVTSQNECQRRMYEMSIAKLTDRISDLEKQIDTEKAVHQANVSFLEKHVTSLQEQVLKWDERMTSDSLSKDRELESLKEYHARDKERLKTIANEYQRAVEEKERREMEHSSNDQKSDRDQKRIEKYSRSAKVIQDAWRRFVERRNKEREKKAGGKKSKKSK